jgi:hypothetical protein
VSRKVLDVILVMLALELCFFSDQAGAAMDSGLASVPFDAWAEVAR